MTTHNYLIAIAFALAGCVDTAPGTESSGPASAEGAAPTVPRILDHASGRWIEEPRFDSPLVAKYPGRELGVIHDVAVRDDGDHDTVTVLASGEPLCKQQWIYRPAAEQRYASAGEMIDYELLADTCDVGMTTAVYEGYALWEQGQPDVLQVLVEPPPPGKEPIGYRPFTAWWRCIGSESPYCADMTAVRRL